MNNYLSHESKPGQLQECAHCVNQRGSLGFVAIEVAAIALDLRKRNRQTESAE
ncbi:hypothetical protein [Pelomonas aquatica]|jgi:hypothetical protein|uniref:hypothetical protein n=1 Tax=Pelomonas aquatica TaxID=431058 RepID=UPI00227C8DC8|nr:hypothetical protein [Pelomonas aquatica]MCY4757111.1 hypothetical protein [Pelomonas aquatica]